MDSLTRALHALIPLSSTRRPAAPALSATPILLAACLAASGLAPGALAHPSAQDPEAPEDRAMEASAAPLEDSSPWQSVFSDTTEVNIVNLEVLVTDKAGSPVMGLAAEDFVLVQNGEPVEISNFYAVEKGRPVALTYDDGEAPPGDRAAPGPAPEDLRQHLIVYIDNAAISEVNRARLFGRLRDFLLKSWRDETQVMLVSNDRGLTVRQPFTGVAHDLFVALEQMEGERGIGERFGLELRNLQRAIEEVNVEAGSGLFDTKSDRLGGDETAQAEAVAQDARRLLPQIRNYSGQRLQHVRNSLRVLGQLVDTAGGLPGRKAVIFVSDGLPLRPGAALLDAFERRFIGIGEAVGSQPSSESGRDDATPLFRKLVADANASHVTFYPLFAAPPAASQRGSAATTAGFGGNFGSWDDSLLSAEQRDSQESLTLMAEGTGGRVGLSNASFDSVLAGVLTDFDNHYSLGYVADALSRDREREIRVALAKDVSVEVAGKTLGKRDLQIRYRNSYRDKTTLEKAAERTRSALLLDELDNPLGVTLETRDVQPQEDGLFVVPLMVRVPLGKLVLLPGQTVHQAKVSMFVAVRDDKGRTSEVNRHLCPIRIPNAELLTALGQSGVCGVRLKMRGGEQRIAVSVLDEIATVDSTVNLQLDVGADRQALSGDPTPSGAPTHSAAGGR